MSERQYGSIDEIRLDHRARYQFARDIINETDVVLDAACGCGYGSHIMSENVSRVYGMDASIEAIDYALENYDNNNIFYLLRELPCELPKVNIITSFETIEHVIDPPIILKQFRDVSEKLICSVPNEEKLPFTAKRFPFHRRHYTKQEFNDLLEEAGWKVAAWYGQVNAHSRVEPDVNGRTLVAVCE